MKAKVNGEEYDFDKVVNYEDLDKNLIGRKREGRHFWYGVAIVLIGCFIVGVVL